MREELAMEENGSRGWVVVTGGGGFIGQHVVRRALEAGFQVAVIDRRDDLPEFPPGVVVMQDDVRNPEVWDALRDGYTDDADVNVEAVVHLAATVSMAECERYPSPAYSNNVFGTIAALDGAVDMGAKRFVLASTAAVYPNGNGGGARNDGWWPSPESVYGRTKVVAEMEALARFGAIWPIVLRFANVYGPGQHVSAESGVLAKWCSAIARGEVLEVWSDGMEERDFIHVSHVAETVIQKVCQVSGETIENVSTGTSRRVKDVLADLITLVADPVLVRFRPDLPGGVRQSLMPPGETVRKTTYQGSDWWPRSLADTLAHYRAVES